MPAYRYFILPAHPAVLALAEAPHLAEYLAIAPAPETRTNGPIPPAPPSVAAWRWRLAQTVQRSHAALLASAEHIPHPWRYLLGIVVLPYLFLVLLYGLLLLPVWGLAWLVRGRAGGAWATRRGRAWFGLLFMGEWNEEDLFGTMLPAQDDPETNSASTITDSREQADQGNMLPPTDSPQTVAKALIHARRWGYRIILYGLPDEQAALQAAVPALIAGGWIDASWPAFDPATLPATLQAAQVHVPDSLLVLHTTAQLPAARAVGFYPVPLRPTQGEVIGWGHFRSFHGRTDHLSVRDISAMTGYYLHSQYVAQTTAGLPTDLVVYVEDAAALEVRAFIATNLRRIETALAAKGLRLLYVPTLAGAAAAPAEAMANSLPALRHRFPRLRACPDAELLRAVTAAAQQLSLPVFSRALLRALGMADFETPALIRRRDSYSTGPTSFGICLLAPPAALAPADREAWLENQLTYYLANVGQSEGGPLFSLAPDPKEYDADWYFQRDGQALPPELLAELTALEAHRGPAALAQVLLHLAAQLRTQHPGLLAQLAPHLVPATPASAPAPPRSVRGLSAEPLDLAELSPLVVTPDLRLLLPAYANLEIELTPLPKALYLFFLTQAPTGLMFHDLVEHQPALLAFYQRLQPGLERDIAQARIRELTDVRFNSVNEKCSRIKAAFAAVLHDRLAAKYYISGQRGGAKGVALPRELVTWPA